MLLLKDPSVVPAHTTFIPDFLDQIFLYRKNKQRRKQTAHQNGNKNSQFLTFSIQTTVSSRVFCLPNISVLWIVTERQSIDPLCEWRREPMKCQPITAFPILFVTTHCPSLTRSFPRISLLYWFVLWWICLSRRVQQFSLHHFIQIVSALICTGKAVLWCVLLVLRSVWVSSELNPRLLLNAFHYDRVLSPLPRSLFDSDLLLFGYNCSASTSKQVTL